MKTEQIAQMHEFITLLTRGLKKAELEAQLRPLVERFREATIKELVGAGVEPDGYRIGKDGEREDVFSRDQLAGAVLRERQGWMDAVKDRDAIIKQLSAAAIRSGK